MKKFFIVSLFIFLAILTFSFIWGNIALAQTSPTSSTSTTTTSTSTKTSVDLSELQGLSASGTPAEIIGRAIRGILSVIGAIALLIVVYGGIILLTSVGKSEKIEKGKKIITWAVLGVAIILGSYVLVGYVISAITGTEGGQPTTNANTTNQCETTNPGWACETLSCNTNESASDCATRLGRNCQTGLCPGSVYNICCEPAGALPTP